MGLVLQEVAKIREKSRKIHRLWRFLRQGAGGDTRIVCDRVTV
jgi:hypothetical protein